MDQPDVLARSDNTVLLDPFLPFALPGLQPRFPALAPTCYPSAAPSAKKRKRSPNLRPNEAEERERHRLIAPSVQHSLRFVSLQSSLYNQNPVFTSAQPSAFDFIAWQNALTGLEELSAGDAGASVSLETPIVRIAPAALFNIEYTNLSSAVKQIQLSTKQSHNFYIPPRSSFLVSSDIESWPTILKNRPIDLIIIDFPWPSASVNRSTAYQTLDMYDYFKINLPMCLSKPCLVASWITNRSKITTFVTQKLYRDWKLHNVKTWYWVKLAADGTAQWPLEGDSRRTYEGLVLGWHIPSESEYKPPPTPDLNFASVSLGHSRKPSILSIVSQAFGMDFHHVVELFSRSIISGPIDGSWFGIGNEAIKFNESVYYEVERDDVVL